MRFRALSLVAGVAVLALTAGGVLAAIDAVDQHQDGASHSWDAGDHGTAQTFTAAVSGHLDRVSLWGLATTGTITGIDLLDGGPTGAFLGASLSATPVNGAWFDAVFSTPVQVTAGSMYAIVLHTSGAVRIGGTCDTGAYTRGDALGFRNDVGWETIPGVDAFDSCIADFAFQEWVIPDALAAPPTVAMAFGAASIPVGGTTSLIFTITNPNTVLTVDARPELVFGTLTNISFTDPLPAGLLIATPNNIVGSCGTITAAAGTNLVSMAGLTLAAGATCTFAVDVVGVAPGVQANTTSAITSTQSDPGLAATASITVTALSTPAPAPTPTQSVLAVTAAPVRTNTPPPTSTGDSRGPGGESPLLPLLALTAVAALAATTFVLRSESRVHHR
jgi:hypothetical protein